MTVRQIGPQIILEGQVPDSKTMSEVLQIVNAELRINAAGMMGGTGGGGGAGGGGAAAVEPRRPRGQGGGRQAGCRPELPAASTATIDRDEIGGPRRFGSAAVRTSSW